MESAVEWGRSHNWTHRRVELFLELRMSEKRAHSPDGDSLAGAIVLGKKQKTGSEIIVGSVTKEGIKRTSNLQAPIMQLIGHGAEVYSMKFSPDGQSLASGAFDKLVYLWRTFGECENFMMLKVRSMRRHAKRRINQNTIHHVFSHRGIRMQSLRFSGPPTGRDF